MTETEWEPGQEVDRRDIPVGWVARRVSCEDDTCRYAYRVSESRWYIWDSVDESFDHALSGNLLVTSPRMMLLSRSGPERNQILDAVERAERQMKPASAAGGKYRRTIHDIDSDAHVTVDVYAVLAAFKVICPARQHAAKKLLCAGLRGDKSTLQDLIEARAAIDRAIQEAQRHYKET